MNRIAISLLAMTAVLPMLGCKKPVDQPPPQATQAAVAAPAQAAPAAPAEGVSLLKPNTLKEQAPAEYRAKFVTSKGEFVIEVHRDWAPLGADRFYNLVKAGYYKDTRFFRVIPGFMVQWGIHGEGEVNSVWREARISDDPVKQHNQRGYVSFATAGPNTRTTQVFINYADNVNLDGMGFAPFGRVTVGMNIVDSIYAGYGEGAPAGRGPSQGRMQTEGNAYLMREFPKLDYITEASILP